MTASVAGWLVVAGAAFAAGGWGSWVWWRVEPSRLFWRLLRGAQALVLAQLVVVAVVFASGSRPDDDLYYLYAGLPVAVSFFAEQLRILSAQTILDRRGLRDAQEVGRLPEREQRSVVLEIVRREIGVMALAALAIGGLALRAALVY